MIASVFLLFLSLLHSLLSRIATQASDLSKDILYNNMNPFSKSSNETQMSKKPKNSNFRQQRLSSWQPIMSPPYVIGCFSFISLLFIPLGAVIVMSNNKVQDIEMRYDNLKPSACAPILTYKDGENDFSQGCRHLVPFQLTETMEAPVYLYYKLSNFYQNHRRFVKSKSIKQLSGQQVTDASECSPFFHPNSSESIELNQSDGIVSTLSINQMIYAPCGLQAWSKFNDSFTLKKDTTIVCNGSAFVQNMPTAATGSCTKHDIIWSTDAEKYKAPDQVKTTWTSKSDKFKSNNTFYNNGWYLNEANHPVPDTTDNDLIVWMRTASLPSFRKLYRVINQNLLPGNYTMVIDDFYSVTSFEGEKAFALATTSWLGGKNPFLGAACFVIGTLTFVLAVAFLGAMCTSKDNV